MVNIIFGSLFYDRKMPWLLPMLTFNMAAVLIQKQSRRWIIQLISRKKNSLLFIHHIDTTPNSSPILKHQNKCTSDNTMFSAFLFVCPYYTIASIQIQSQWRQWKHKKYIQLYNSYSKESFHLKENKSFTTDTNKGTESRVLTIKDAAKKIQRWRRSHIYKRIYRIFRDLIKFRLIGDPKQLLRTINPNEAYLFDKSTKIYVRFRLGSGYSGGFPPVIYYKVFTHGTVCDLGSFAPKNYKKKEFRLPGSSKQTRNAGSLFIIDGEPMTKSQLTETNTCKGFIRVGNQQFRAKVFLDDDGTEGWYQRQENNGWRPVGVEIQNELMKNDMENKITKSPKSYLHIGDFPRKKVFEVRRRRKYYEQWKKLYQVGTEENNAGEKNIPCLKSIELCDNLNVYEGLEHFAENVNYLLQWTEDLDYEEYLR